MAKTGRMILISLSLLIPIFLALSSFTDRRLNRMLTYVHPRDISPEVQQLHASLFIGDLHCDSLLWRRNLWKRFSHGHVDFPRLKEGNVALQMFTAVTKSPLGLNLVRNSNKSLDTISLLTAAQSLTDIGAIVSMKERALKQAAYLHYLAKEHPVELLVVKDRASLMSLIERRKKGEKIIGAMLGIEGLHCLEGKQSSLQDLWDAGYRMAAMTHFMDTELGGSAHGEEKHGITSFGELIADEMEAKGMVIDLSHSSLPLARALLARPSTIPMVYSHTGVYAVCPSE